jgi:hypothetical protein
VKENPHLPDPSRLSVLTATILLSFALTRILNVPQGNISIPVFGLMLTIPISLNLAITLLSAALTAAGMDWLLRTHSSLEEGETREHWLLPALTVLVLGITLNTLPDGLTWWLGFTLGAILLVLVLISEYVAVDPSDIRYPMATAALTSLAFAIFLVLAGALKASNGRLFLVAPAIFGGSFLAALRTLHLRLNERWEYAWAIGIGLVGMQLGAALHYWPLTPVRFGLALLAPVYALTILAVAVVNGTPFRKAALDPGIMLVLLWGLIIWFR